jgi:hypothetical protein
MRGWRWSLWALGLVSVAGCGSSGSGAGGGRATGVWNGTWAGTADSGTGTFVMQLVESANGSVSGSVTFTGSPCFANADLDGVETGDALHVTAMAGGIQANLDATITGAVMSGTFDVVAGGACSGGTGTFSGSL